MALVEMYGCPEKGFVLPDDIISRSCDGMRDFKKCAYLNVNKECGCLTSRPAPEVSTIKEAK
jgi:hypothetical protein